MRFRGSEDVLWGLRLHLSSVDRLVVTDSGSSGPTGQVWLISTPSHFLCLSGGRTPAIVAGERGLLEGIRGQVWIRHS